MAPEGRCIFSHHRDAYLRTGRVASSLRNLSYSAPSEKRFATLEVLDHASWVRSSADDPRSIDGIVLTDDAAEAIAFHDEVVARHSAAR